MNRRKSFKNRAEFVKDDVIDHIVMEHPQNDKSSELLGKTQILPKKLIQEGVKLSIIFCYGILAFCILLQNHISSFNETCLFFVSLLF